jgi:hypothetical protein
VSNSGVELSSSSTRDLQYDCNFIIPGPASVRHSKPQFGRKNVVLLPDVEECSSKLAAFTVHSNVPNATVLANKTYNRQYTWLICEFRQLLFRSRTAGVTVNQCYFATESATRRQEGSNRSRTVDSLIAGVFRTQMQFVLFNNLYKRKICIQIYYHRL